MYKSERFKLGLVKKPLRPRTLRLAKYMMPALPPPPPSRVWGAALTDLPMFGNDTYGDCTCASFADAIASMTEEADKLPDILADTDVVAAYMQMTGGADEGLDEETVLSYLRKTGIGGHKIGAWGAVEDMQVEQAIELFGGVKLDVDLPDDYDEQLASGVWDILQKQPDPMNGHSIWCDGYDADGSLHIWTWGRRMLLTPAFRAQAVSARFGLIAPDWLEQDGHAPNGFDSATLNADLNIVTA